MKIIHFSTTALAGMPLRLVRALQKHTSHEVHLIDLKADYERGNFYFGHDVAFDLEPERAIELAETADIIHLHNYLDLDSSCFAPIDFRRLRKKGTLFVRQFHSTPALVAEKLGISVQELMLQDIPALVIAQYPERYYPQARVVPNFVPQDDSLYLPPDSSPRWDVFYSSTQERGAFEARWDTKGMPETQDMLERLEDETGCRVKITAFAPFIEVMEHKRQSRIVLDDLVTGSYHLTGLEGLSLAKPTFSYMDSRTRMLMQHFSGTLESPYINVCLEDAEAVIMFLLANPELAREVGANGRKWLEKHWSEQKMVQHFTQVYEDLSTNPELIRRQPELELKGSATTFLNKNLPDLIQLSRASRFGADVEKVLDDLEGMEA